MRRVTTAMSVMAVLLWATAAYAQKPNFSGKWTVDAEKTAAANPNAMAGGGGGGGRGGGRGGGGSFEIKQDATSLTRTAIQQDGSMGTPQVYKLDGSPSKIMMGRAGQETEVTATAKWVGNTIEIVTTTQNGESKAVYSMDGADLKIVSTQPGRGGGEATTRTTIYKKG